MNTPAKSHELYKKMIGMKGKFTIVFINLTKYEGATLEDAIYHWDEETQSGTAEIHTRLGKIHFNFNQVAKIK